MSGAEFSCYFRWYKKNKQTSNQAVCTFFAFCVAHPFSMGQQCLFSLYHPERAVGVPAILLAVRCHPFLRCSLKTLYDIPAKAAEENYGALWRSWLTRRFAVLDIWPIQLQLLLCITLFGTARYTVFCVPKTNTRKPILQSVRSFSESESFSDETLDNSFLRVNACLLLNFKKEIKD